MIQIEFRFLLTMLPLQVIDQFIFQNPQLRIMDQSPMNSPAKLTKPGTSSSELHFSKSKIYLPSRYMQEKGLQKTGFHDILNEIETHVKEEQDDKGKQVSPKKIKLKQKQLNIEEYSQNQKESQFKARPLKREESDIQNFNEIFLNHREDALKQLQKHSKIPDNSKTISKEYERLLQFETGYVVDDKKEQVLSSEIPKHFSQCIQMLSTQQQLFSIQPTDKNFFEEHIKMDPPQHPNNSSSSTIAPGSGYAPSIPPNLKTNKDSNIKELLMRAKAGMNTDDIEKQAHLSYFLGEVYESKRSYSAALKFYKRFLGFAKAMEDKIGMCLGANRLAINYFCNGDIPKSIVFHNENLKLADTQNCFTGFYNLGICYRKLNKLQEALEYFESAYNWAHQKGQQQSQCIALGQMGVTYQKMQLFQQSLQKFQKSLEISEKIKNNSMQLNNLRHILRISAQFSLKPIETLDLIAQQAYKCSKNTTDIKLQNILRCNLGILRGSIEFSEVKKEMQSCDEIEQLC